MTEPHYEFVLAWLQSLDKNNNNNNFKLKQQKQKQTNNKDISFINWYIIHVL